MTNLADCLKINRKQMFIVNAFLPEECVFYDNYEPSQENGPSKHM